MFDHFVDHFVDIFVCDFESGPCGMAQHTDDQFDWLLNDGSVPGHQGPRSADGGSGNHYYIEATDSKTAPNETARSVFKCL